jgi:hypothetical protein
MQPTMDLAMGHVIGVDDFLVGRQPLGEQLLFVFHLLPGLGNLTFFRAHRSNCRAYRQYGYFTRS